MSGNTPVHANLSLMHDYTQADAAAPHPVTITQYGNDKQKLYYINAEHGAGTDNPTVKAIDQAIDTYKPQLVIIEGVETSKGISPQDLVQYAQKSATDGFAHASESTYAAYAASQKSIDFQGGEPSSSELFSAMEKQGYSAKDMMGMYLARNVSQWRRQGTLNPLAPGQQPTGEQQAKFNQLATDYLNKDPAFKDIPAADRLKPEDFKEWYKKKTGSDNYLASRQDDFAPFNTPGATYFQKMNHDLARVREQHLDQTIADAYGKYDRVLVVYGGSHLIMSGAVYEDMFKSHPPQDKGEKETTAIDYRNHAKSEGDKLKAMMGSAYESSYLSTPSLNLPQQTLGKA